MQGSQWLKAPAVAAIVAALAASEGHAATAEKLGKVGVKLQGVVDTGEVGFDAVNVGDLDADGHEELLIGAPFGDAGRGSDGGANYLFYGPVDESVQVSAADVIFLGGRPGDFAGEDVGAAGDLDGDGFDDLILGTPGSIPGVQPGDPRPGEAYLFYGGTRRRSGVVLLQPDCVQDRTCDAGFTGHHPSDFAGFGLPKHPVGDVDRDGKHDLLIGSAGFGAYGGAAHLFYGEGRRFEGMTRLAAADATFLATPGRISTTPMTGAGDLDGDGYADFAIGAASWFPTATAPGEVYVYYGGAQRRSGVTPMAAADAVLAGEVAGDRAGDGLAGGADVDADGLADLLVGVPGAEDSSPGTAHLIHGSKDRLAGPLSLLDVAGATVFTGAEAGDQAGEGVALGDIDGDGFADAAIGAPEAGEGGTTYVVPGGPRRTQAFPLDQAARRFVAEEEADRAGATVVVGRFAGGRTAGLAIAAPGHQGGRGATYVIGGTGPAVAPPQAPAPSVAARRTPRLEATARGAGRHVVVRGRLSLPEGVGRRRGCTGRVAVVLQRGTRVVGRRTARISRTCAFRLRVRVGSRPRRALVSFRGNGAVGPRAVRVRVR